MTDLFTLQRVPVARRAQAMIGQKEAWQQIQEAISPRGDRSFRVVLLRAQGGMGKSRFLEQMLTDAGRNVEPLAGLMPSVLQIQELGDPVVGNAVDVIETQLHDRYRFVTALRRSLRPYPNLEFTRFDAAENRVRVLTAAGALLTKLDEARREAVTAFVEDLRRIAQSRRVVFLVDTAERLRYQASEWLLNKGLLNSDDLEMRTQEWLHAFISSYELENVTLVLAGRGREGQPFFDRIEETTRRTIADGRNCRLIPIGLKRLSMEQTREFFDQLARDYAERGPEYSHIAEAFRLVTDQEGDQYKAITLLTDGVPIRLALVAQLMGENRRVPEALNKSFQQVCQDAGLEAESLDPSIELPDDLTPELKLIQWQTEESLVGLLFEAPHSRRYEVMRALVRAPHGLTPEQLHFALDAPDGASPEEWLAELGDEARDTQEELLQQLELLADDYWVKRRGALEDLEPLFDENRSQTATVRIGPQDEFYRIYAEHMGLLADPVSNETAGIREKLTEKDRQRYEQNQQDEQAARQAHYAKLADFADYRLRVFTARKRELLLEDEANFDRDFRLEAPRTYRLPELDMAAVEERNALMTALSVYAIERMIYRLLRDPERNLNHEYLTLTPEPDNQKAASQEEDFGAQTEMWLALNDPWLMKFVPLTHDRQPAKTRGESPRDVLTRVTEQENVTRWLKRFVTRGKFGRAVEFGRRFEEVAEGWPRGGESAEGRKQRNAWESWNHTLAREERSIWVQLAVIRQGKEVPGAIERMKQSVTKLTRLFATDVRTPAFKFGGRQENGFAAAPNPPDPSDPDYVNYLEHPAYDRVRRLLSFAHNSLGYSFRTLGLMGEAAIHYRKALEYVRVDIDEMRPQRAKVLNNYSRVLSELGWNSIGMCQDGRDIRLELAEEVPLAGSYNTLALIYDDMGRYQDAPLLSAKAIAYCRRANEQRQQGLALRQMAESLRHIAERTRTGQSAAYPPDVLFKAAEELLREAREIFSGLEEAERLIEVSLELGSLYRDRMQTAPGRPQPRSWRKYYEEAAFQLNSVERAAAQNGMAQHLLDARVNQLRIHYFAGQLDEAKRVFDRITHDSDYSGHVITPDHLPSAKKARLRNRNWIFRHLSTTQMIAGWMAADRFEARVEALKREFEYDTPQQRQERVAADRVAQDALRDMVWAYALGIAYAQLYSPRSRSINGMQNDLYGRMKKFNRSELNKFLEHLQAFKVAYPKVSSVHFLFDFVDEFFGGPEVVAIPRRDKSNKP
jgi:tetratricopeptide (TPR) repeat protein